MYTILVNKVKIFEAKLFVLKIRDLPIVALLFTYGMSISFFVQVAFQRLKKTPFKLSAHLAEIAIECAFFGSKVQFLGNFLA